LATKTQRIQDEITTNCHVLLGRSPSIITNTSKSRRKISRQTAFSKEILPTKHEKTTNFSTRGSIRTSFRVYAHGVRLEKVPSMFREGTQPLILLLFVYRRISTNGSSYPVAYPPHHCTNCRCIFTGTIWPSPYFRFIKKIHEVFIDFMTSFVQL